MRIALLLLLRLAGPAFASQTLAVTAEAPVRVLVEGRELCEGPPALGVTLEVPPGTYDTLLLGADGEALARVEVTLAEGEDARLTWSGGQASLETTRPRQGRERAARAGRGLLRAAATAGALAEAGRDAKEGVDDTMAAAERGEAAHTRTEISIGADGVASDTTTAVAGEDGSVDVTSRSTRTSTGPDGVHYERHASDTRVEIGEDGASVDEAHRSTAVGLESPALPEGFACVEVTGALEEAPRDSERPETATQAADPSAPAALDEPPPEHDGAKERPPGEASDQEVEVTFRLRGMQGLRIRLGEEHNVDLIIRRQATTDLVPGTYEVEVREATLGRVRYTGQLTIPAQGGEVHVGPRRIDPGSGFAWE